MKYGKTIKQAFRWEEPPPVKLQEPDEELQKIVEELKSNPKRWALAAETDTKPLAFPSALSGKQFERKYRSFKKDDGTRVYKNYVRYVDDSVDA